MTDPLRADIIGALRASRKYANLCEDTLARIADWAASRHRRLSEAIKAAKRKLHQVYAAYVDQGSVDRAARLLDGLESTDDESTQETCREILRCHASTAERMPIVERVYADLFAHTGAPHVVLDLACGLNPFALPWMPLGPDAEYHPCDVDRRLIGLVNRFLALRGRPPTAECRDILTSPPDRPADVALLLKTVPCLERQQSGATLELLRRLHARHTVLSFPATTLGGKDKGMRDHYGTLVTALAGGLVVAAMAMEYDVEAFYVLWRDTG